VAGEDCEAENLISAAPGARHSRKKEQSMSHTYVQNLVHIVFSTKERRKLILLDQRTKLWAFIGRRLQQRKDPAA